MRLICPNCVAQYEVDENVIPPEGRDVQCANCGHNWFQDSVQMFSHHSDAPAGSGDPDSDVPPELFNDLEGRLDTDFVSPHAQTAPDPNDMEPEKARDDFQIEQEPDAPSSRLDQDVLDVLRTEAEYSSGEKPPAMVETASSDTLWDGSIRDVLQETQDAAPQLDDPIDPTSSEATQETEIPEVIVESADSTEKQNEPEAVDDLDEIRRRIMELEAQEDDIGPTPIYASEEEQEPVAQEISFEPNDDLTLADLDAEKPEHTSEPADPFAVEYVKPQNGDSPFSRPTASGGARNTVTEHVPPSPPERAPELEQDIPPSTDEPIYEENIPYEEHIPTPPSANQEMDTAIETLVAEQTDAQAISDRPRSKVAARPFPNVDNSNDELYGASQDRTEARKDMLPDVDELSSEIANDAENGVKDTQAKSKPAVKSKGSFLKGFKYALLLCIIIGILYLMQPIIVEYIPQAEGFLNQITQLVNMVAELIRSIAAQIQGMIG